METTVATKAYKINLNRIDEGYSYSEVICHASTFNEAKSRLLQKVRYDGMKLRLGDDLTYLNIPVVRAKEYDLVDFEGKYISQFEVHEILDKRKRMDYFNSILTDQSVTHCYIRKHGSYYRPNACGYTQIKAFAGVYEKSDAISHGKSCSDLQIIPINSAEHNKMIESEIEDFKTRLI